MAPKSSKKPVWVVEKERNRGFREPDTFWLFGIHAVRDALLNPLRKRHRLVVTRNANDRLADAILHSGMKPEISDPRNFSVPLDPQSVHQGAALQVSPLNWGSVSELCAPKGQAPCVVLLDRVSDPHNAGAVLRSSEVFGARAVIAPHRHSAPETGALAKTASGALERQPYLRVSNLANVMLALRKMGYFIIGLDGEAEVSIATACASVNNIPIALAMGAEGPGLRDLTKKNCDVVAKIPSIGDFGSLNVSNAAAIALYAASVKTD